MHFMASYSSQNDRDGITFWLFAAIVWERDAFQTRIHEILHCIHHNQPSLACSLCLHAVLSRFQRSWVLLNKHIRMSSSIALSASSFISSFSEFDMAVVLGTRSDIRD
ncbi:hypothetical protein O6H91_21G051800 [Diphasiastrum complanatum]|uniref:Uncharacterized protein n=1 Tax=Diphasiastrum complanatum TaxID=34168 RepID=A0ACC2AKC3_DIPCM|nr:hypothetical protein O6H91_21G051800 [Diphasiastrum complanatum]